MSKQKRPLPEIQKEFTQACADIGHLVFMQENLPKQLDELQRRAKQLDSEYREAADAFNKSKPSVKTPEGPQATQ